VPRSYLETKKNKLRPLALGIEQAIRTAFHFEKCLVGDRMLGEEFVYATRRDVYMMSLCGMHKQEYLGRSVSLDSGVLHCTALGGGREILLIRPSDQIT
jgi:hypothetical protein